MESQRMELEKDKNQIQDELLKLKIDRHTLQTLEKKLFKDQERLDSVKKNLQDLVKQESQRIVKEQNNIELQETKQLERKKQLEQEKALILEAMELEQKKINDGKEKIVEDNKKISKEMSDIADKYKRINEKEDEIYKQENNIKDQMAQIESSKNKIKSDRDYIIKQEGLVKAQKDEIKGDEQKIWREMQIIADEKEKIVYEKTKIEREKKKIESQKAKISEREDALDLEKSNIDEEKLKIQEERNKLQIEKLNLAEMLRTREEEQPLALSLIQQDEIEQHVEKLKVLVRKQRHLVTDENGNDISNDDNVYLPKSKRVLAGSITIPDGSYELAQIATILKKEFSKKGIHFRMEVNENTMRTEIYCSNANIDFTQSDSIRSILGFQSRILNAGETHISDNVVNILKVNIIRVECSLASGAFINGKPCHTIHEFFPDVAPGYKLDIVPKTITYLPIVRKSIPSVTVRFLDQDDNLIDFRNETLTCRLHIRRVNE